MPIKGLKEHQARSRRLPVEAERAVTAALLTGAEYTGNVASVSITTGSASMGHHVVSKPGSSLNANLGTLHGSIQGVRFGKLKARVVVTAPYATALEKGTSKMAARPYLVPARNKSKEHVRDLAAKAMNAALKRSRTK